MAKTGAKLAKKLTMATAKSSDKAGKTSPKAAKPKAVKPAKAPATPAAAQKKAKPVQATKTTPPSKAPESAPEEQAPKVAKPIKEAKVKIPKVKVEKKSKATLAAEKALSDDAKKWSDLKQKHGGEKAQAYSMSGTFEVGRPIQHKILGWGFITQIQNDRLEVLFESGSKILISNYKP